MEMDRYQEELIVYRLLSGRLKVGDLMTFYPDMNTLYESQEIFLTSLEEAKDNGCISSQEVQEMFFNEENEANLKTIYDEIDRKKIELFNNFSNIIYANRIRSELVLLKQTQNILLENKHKYDYLSDYGVAYFAKWSYITSKCMNTESPSEKLVSQFLSSIGKNALSEEQCKHISLCGTWKQYWNLIKRGLYKIEQPNVEQVNLFNTSIFFDVLQENPDAPKDEIIHDSDALDGWILVQNKKSRIDVSRTTPKAVKNKKGNVSTDVFVMVNSKDEVQDIYDINSPQARMIVKARQKQMEKGPVQEKELVDIKHGIQMEKNKMRAGK